MRRAKRSAVSVLSAILIISLWLAGCGPTNGYAPLTGEFLYIGNSGDGTISEFSINTTTGKLKLIGSFNATGPAILGLAVHPTNEFLYAIDQTSNAVLGLDIGDGVDSGLIFQQNSNVPTGNMPFDVAITPNGKFLYATDNNASEVSEYSIDLTSGTPFSPNLNSGALTSIGTVASGAFPTGIAVESTGNYAYAVLVAGVSEYAVQADGTLAANGTLIFPSEILLDKIATSHMGTTACAYVTDAGIPGALHEMAIDNSTGTLTYLGKVSGSETVSLQAIAVHPNGKFIYVTQPFVGGGDSAKIEVFTQVPPDQDAPACTVGLTSETAISHPSGPLGIAVEPMGKYAYTANYNSGNVGEFSINSSTGALTSIGEVNTESPFKLTSRPFWAVTTH